MIFLKQPKVISWELNGPYYEIMNHHCPLKKHRNGQYQAGFFSWLTSFFPGQPALLYLVPCTLGLTVLLSLCSGHPGRLSWRGGCVDGFD